MAAAPGAGASGASGAASSAAPWAAYTGASGASAGPAREDPVWKMAEHASCLGFLPALPPAPAPPNVNTRPGAPDELLEALGQHAIEAIPPELLCNRRDCLLYTSDAADE